MEVKAVGRYLRVAPRKARYVLEAVRGKPANEALSTLKFVPNQAARYVEKVIKSAMANAENNYAIDRETLRILRAYADQGPTMKRIHPRAMGRAYRILHRMSHITVVLTEDESLKKAVVKPKGRRGGRKASAESEATQHKPRGPRKTPKPQSEDQMVPDSTRTVESSEQEKKD